MTLRLWLNKQNPTQLAKTLKVSSGAIRHWRRGFVMPGPEHMARILELSHGKVDLNASVREHYSPKNARTRYVRPAKAKTVKTVKTVKPAKPAKPAKSRSK